MSLRLKLFAAFALIAGLSLFFVFNIVTDELKPAMRQAMEETLIDTSIMLAEVAREDIRSGSLQEGRLVRALERYNEVKPDALVWGVHKSSTDHRIYVTDAKGIIIFDSHNGRAVGADYSRWNDVYLTLQGKYGARSTPTSEKGQAVMYVAAPIHNDSGKLIGVLSVGKPGASIDPYFANTRDKILQAALLLFLAAIVVAMLLAWWHGRDVTTLVDYADKVRSGKNAQLPHLKSVEMKRLGQAVEQMFLELEGKEYVEKYIHALTHELKSPLTAVAGAAELLENENIAHADRVRFLKNIRTENKRMQSIIEQLLNLAALEKRKILSETVKVNLSEQITGLIGPKESLLSSRNIALNTDFLDSLEITGEPFLTSQALDNLISNAIDFTPENGMIDIRGYKDKQHTCIEITNSGAQIPDYALNRIFERFYSLPRPDSGQKSTGLGLPFAREAAHLHGGDIQINNTDKGVRAVIRFKISND